jgi:hypothetical protein
MNPNIRFSDLTPTQHEARPVLYEQYDTHIVSSDWSVDWKPLEIEVSTTWSNLVRRVRGEA